MAMLDLKKLMCTSVVSAALVSTSLYAAPKMSKLPTSAWGLNDQYVLFNVNPYQPDVILNSVSITGLHGNDQLIGIDYRVARGDLYGLANSKPFSSCSPVSMNFLLSKPSTTRPINERPLCAKCEPKFAGASMTKCLIGTVFAV